MLQMADDQVSLPLAIMAFPFDIEDAGRCRVAKAVPEPGRHVNVSSLAWRALVCDNRSLGNTVCGSDRHLLSAVRAIVVLRRGESDEECRVRVVVPTGSRIAILREICRDA